MTYRHALARCVIRCAGQLNASRRDEWWGDLLYTQREVGESGLKQALSCLIYAPILAFLRLVVYLWERSHIGAVIDAGFAAAVTLTPLDLNLSPGVSAGLVGAFLGGAVVVLVTSLRAGPRMGSLVGVPGSLTSGVMAGVSGLDAGLRVALDDPQSVLASLFVVSLIARCVAELHLHSRRRLRTHDGEADS